ncbi:hypothetical protein KV205_08540 [Streptomyces sp. SKN60]|uniref:DUF6153 family protein n=1 Tax=Streptomyces sp. SKN60 TaxID=2855506 RepID=UPI002245D64C|nr:DUF6153 family protein [Streptomyces sp. SKN60]MCX2180571.1 hypothetical protein [Streptomyces sp. SKN60]
MTARRSTAPWVGRCLLAVALLFGVVLMHALGHPGEHSGPGPAEQHATHMTAERSSSVAPSSHSTHPAPAHGAEAAAVCLAVLGAGIGALLLKGAARRRPFTLDVPPPSTRLAYALRAIPPPAPPGSLLTLLSLSRR